MPLKSKGLAFERRGYTSPLVIRVLVPRIKNFMIARDPFGSGDSRRQVGGNRFTLKVYVLSFFMI